MAQSQAGRRESDEYEYEYEHEQEHRFAEYEYDAGRGQGAWRLRSSPIGKVEFTLSRIRHRDILSPSVDQRSQGYIDLSQEHGKTAGLRHECLGCGGGKCPGDSAPDGQLLDGWRLSFASLVFFALPAVCAILGAALSRSTPLNELAGAWIGLTSGLVASGVMARFFGDRKETA